MLLLRNKILSSLFILLTLLYAGLTFLVDVDQKTLDKYDISQGQVKAILLTIALPYVIIWFIALAGYLRVRTYSRFIEDSPDGKAFSVISRGLFWLVLWMPLTAVASALGSNYYADNPASTATIVILLNYLNLAILFSAFYNIYLGSTKLTQIVKRPAFNPTLGITLAYIAFAALYVLFTLSDTSRRDPVGTVEAASYYQPDWLIVSTILIPRLIMWFLGILAVQNILLYRQKIKGKIYKSALNSLALGIGWVVLSTIVLRCYQSLGSQLDHTGLGLMVVIIYILLILISIGYILISKGAKNLQKLEEI